MRVLVCGGRSFGDTRAIFKALDAIDQEHGVTEIIQGGASGADTWARTWAKLSKVQCRTFQALWARDGKAAGPMRNQRMIDEGKPDLVVAFPGGRGTADMVRRAQAAGVKVLQPLTSPAKESSQSANSQTQSQKRT